MVDGVADHRLDREDWIAAGLDALESGGVEAVAVVPLARALGVTRGSFYWHFSSRDELLEAVLARWEDEHSAQTLLAVLEDRGPARAPARDPRPRRAEAPVVLRAPARRGGPRAARRRHARALGEGAARHARQGATGSAAMPAADARRSALLAYAAYVGLARMPLTGPGSLSARERARARATTWSRRSCPEARRPSTLRGRADAVDRTDPCRAPARRRPPRAGAGDHARGVRRPARLGPRPRGLPAHREGRDRRPHRRSGGRQVDPHQRARQAPARAGPHARGALDRPVLAVHPRRAARGSHPPDRPLPRPGRLHPLDGQPRRARRAQRGGAPGGAADGRGRPPGHLPRDGRRRAGRGRHHRSRRHDRARADAGLRRLDPGAEGRASWRSRTSSSSTRPTTR